MSDELLCRPRRLSSCRRMRSMKSNSPRRVGTVEVRRDEDELRRDRFEELRFDGVEEFWAEDSRRVGREASLSSVNSSLITHHSSLKLEVAAHRVEAGADRLYRGREGEAQAALAVLAEDDAGHCGDLRAFGQGVGAGGAAGLDVRHFGEGVERAVRRVADEAEFAEAGD